MNEHFYFQPKNFRHQLTELDGCKPRVTLKPDMKCGIGAAIGATLAAGTTLGAVGGGLIGAAAGTSLIGAGMSYMGAQAQADATKEASKSAAAAQADANAKNYQMFKEGRGSEGSAVLPLYLKQGDKMFEQQMGEDLMKAYGETAPNMAAIRAASGQMAEAQRGAAGTVGDIFNGGITGKMQRNVAPVQAERMTLARNSSLDALHKTLNDIDSTQAQRGFVGDSYGSRLMKFQAGRQAGADIGAAHLANTQQTADIKNYGDVTLPMQSLTLPSSMAAQNANFQFLPSDVYLQQMSQRMQPFNFMKLQPSTFQYAPLPTAPPDMSKANMWNAIGGGIKGLGSAAGMLAGGLGGGGGGGIDFAKSATINPSAGLPAAASSGYGSAPLGGWGSSGTVIPSTMGMMSP